MLKSVTIENFQSHKNTTLDLTSGVNVIVGQTDAGKSALFRAIVWGLFNRPRGEGFRSHWAGKEPAKVTIELTDGTTIQRVRGNGINEYHLNDSVFEAFGHDPPEEILKAHGIDNRLSIQSQIDPFFLLQSTPGDVAAYLNQVAQLSDIDTVNKNLASHSRTIQRDISMLTEVQSNLSTALEGYVGLEKTGDLIDQVEQLSSDIDTEQQRFDQLKTTADKITIVIGRIEKTRSKLTVKPLIDQAIELKNDLQTTKQKRDNLARTIRNIEQLKTSITDHTKILTDIAPHLKQGLQLQSELKELNRIRKILSQTIESIKDKQVQVTRSRTRLNDLEDEWHENLPEGSVCPLCDSIIV